MPEPEGGVAAVDAGRRGAVLRELRQGPARQALRPARARSAAGCKVTTTLDVGLQQMARDAIASVLPQNGTGPTAAVVVLDAHTGAVLAMVGGENYHRNQFNLATQGERQPGSSFKPFVLATALQAERRAVDRCSPREPVTINADGRLWKVNNYEGEYLGPHQPDAGDRLLGQLGLLAADRARRPAQRPRHGARARDHDEAERLLRDRARRRAGDAARDGARLRELRRRRLPRRRLDLRQPAARDLEDSGLEGQRDEQNDVVAKPVLTPTQAETINQLLQGVVQYGTGKAAALPGPPGRRQDRHDRELRRRVVRRLHAAVRRRGLGRLSRQARPDDDRVPRQAGRRRHVPGADLEGVHAKALGQASRPRPSRRPTTATPRRSPSSTAAACSSATTASATTRRSCEFFGGEGPAAASRRCKANEVEIPDTVGMSLADARARLEGQPLTPQVVYKPARTGQRLGVVVGQFPRTRHRVGGRQDHDRAARSRCTASSRTSSACRSQRAQAKLARLKLEVSTTRRLARQGGRAVGRGPTPRPQPGEKIALTVRGTGG